MLVRRPAFGGAASDSASASIELLLLPSLLKKYVPLDFVGEHRVGKAGCWQRVSGTKVFLRLLDLLMLFLLTESLKPALLSELDKLLNLAKLENSEFFVFLSDFVEPPVQNNAPLLESPQFRPFKLVPLELRPLFALLSE